MPTLLDKIELDAEKRLKLPAGRRPAEELSRYKRFLKLESHRLRMLHRSGVSGREVCKARAAVYDLLIRHILEGVLASQPELQTVPPAPWALVATGGYGRAELNPLSDIDIMFLFHGELVSRGKPNPYLSALNEGLLLTLWDIGLKVGHSVRGIFDCVQLANRDMQSKTSLIEARLITGNSELFRIFQQNILEKCVTGHTDEYLQARMEDQTSRRTKYGDSALMQEPNIKNGCGGLRDYQNLLWMAFFKHGTRSLTDLVRQELLSASERRQLRRAYDFLLRVRNEMHTHFAKATPAMDVLPKNLQPTVASALGYGDRSPSRRIEKFMHDLYVHMRHIYLITATLEQRMALNKKPGRLEGLRNALRLPGRKSPGQTLDGFRIVDGELRQLNNRIFREQPRRLMRAFLHAQQRGLRLHPDLNQLIRQSLSLVNREFLKDPHVRETFLEILNHRGSVAPVLRAMHDVDFLGKYIPEFGRLTCLVQHEFFHVYAADEHVLVCLEQLDDVWEATKPPHSHYTEMFQELDRPYILYLALLLHDAGKGLGKKGKHAEVGGVIADRVSRRLALDATTSHLLRLLIEHHLLMAMTSQRRDLEDANVINNFAKAVQTPPALSMLTLHTFADAMGTSEKLWNGFKDTLLRTLYDKTLRIVTGGTTFIRARVEQRDRLQKFVRRHVPGSVTDEEIEAHFDALPPRYFRLHSPEEVAADVALVNRFLRWQMNEEKSGLDPVVRWHAEPDRGYTALQVGTWDRPGLFSRIVGSLSAIGLNILSAQAFSRTDGLALDTFFVTRATGEALISREDRERLEALLTKVLNGTDVDFSKRIAKGVRAQSAHKILGDEAVPTRVYFDNDVSEEYTVIDVEAVDRLGLLFVITNAFAELDLNLALAKIVTEKGAAVDSFYVNEIVGGKITASERQREIASRLLQAINSQD
ncbi:[protein-PII] uridylyltransferase [bacterium]|nr:[protein-PII] uridylyltransferase [bacterium]